MKIGDEVYIHGYVDEIRQNVVIIKNDGGYFGTVAEEITNKSEIPNTCGDAISRQAVLDIIDFEDKWLLDAKRHNADTEIAFSGMKSRIADLPSVSSQQRTGRWVKKEHNGIVLFMCSNCRKEHLLLYDYCPTCGAKMEEKNG